MKPTQTPSLKTIIHHQSSQIAVPLELVDLIVHQALIQLKSDHLKNLSIGFQSAKQELIKNLRLVCKDWGEYYFVHHHNGLFNQIRIKHQQHLHQLIDCWSHPSHHHHGSVVMGWTRIPYIRRLRLDNITTIWDHHHHQTTRARAHLSVETLKTLLQACARTLIELELHFVDCMAFPASIIDIIHQLHQLKSLTIGVSRSVISTITPISINKSTYDASSFFNFLAHLPTLVKITLLDWDIPCGFHHEQSSLLKTGINHLTLQGPHAHSIEYILHICHHLKDSIRILDVDVGINELGRLIPVITSMAPHLQALAIQTRYTLAGYRSLLTTPFPDLKILMIQWNQLLELRSWIGEALLVKQVETLAIGMFDYLDFNHRYKSPDPPGSIWRSALRQLVSLKRLIIILPAACDHGSRVPLHQCLSAGVEMSVKSSCEILELLVSWFG